MLLTPQQLGCHERSVRVLSSYHHAVKVLRGTLVVTVVDTAGCSHSSCGRRSYPHRTGEETELREDVQGQSRPSILRLLSGGRETLEGIEIST